MPSNLITSVEAYDLTEKLRLQARVEKAENTILVLQEQVCIADDRAPKTPHHSWMSKTCKKFDDICDDPREEGMFEE